MPLWSLAFCGAVTLLSAPAAADTVVWRATSLKEENKTWSARAEFKLDRAPDVAYVPMKFTFTAKTYFESSLVDGRDKPVVRELPVATLATADFERVIVQDMEVGFSDPATGNTFKQSKLSLALPRARGFVAAEYEVAVENTRSGTPIGSPTLLRLNGENPPVDRRSIVMPDRKPAAKTEAPPSATQESTLTPQDDAFWEGGDTRPLEPKSPLPPPAHLQQKPGCGCRLSDSASRSQSALGLVLLLGAGLSRRRGGKARAAR